MSMSSDPGLRDRLVNNIPPSFERWWADTKSTLWFFPTIASVLAVLLAGLSVYLDDTMIGSSQNIDSPWLFGAGSDGARGVLMAIAGSVMAVIGTVFSITIVALQLASSQFTPRVLRQFTGDRINQSVLAVFIGTFTYCLLVLRTVQDPTDQVKGFVPVISVTVAIVLAMACVAFLIAFIHHMAQQMQVSYILNRASDDALSLVHSYFRDSIEDRPELNSRNYAQGEGQDVLSTSSGYCQHYDIDYLLTTAHDNDLTIRMLVPMGAYLNTRQPIARIWTSNGEDVDLETAGKAVRGAFVTGAERTLTSDLPLGIRQIIDIGLKAMSPGINDPTTATQALDRISEVLAQAGHLEPPERILYVEDRPAVFLPRIGFSELTNIAFTQIRHYAKSDLIVMLHLVRTIERVASLVDRRHHDGLVRHLELVKAAGIDGLAIAPERHALVRTIDEAEARIETYETDTRTPAVPDMIQDI
jgi:uncharacterized membrane protein